MKPQRGFSLIELLVVLAILGVLTGLLLPTLSAVKERSRMAQCLGNIRQLGLGLRMYAEDHGKYPLAFSTNVPGRRIKFSWGIGGASGADFARPRHGNLPSAEERPLFHYVKPGLVFRCTADSGIPFPAARVAPTLYAATGTSYRYNTWVPECFDAVSKGQGKPDQLIVLSEPSAEAFSYSGDLKRGSLFIQWHNRRGKTGVFETDPARLKARFVSPIAFFDGHVARVDFTRRFLSDSTPNGPGPNWMWHV